jgi:hypothetical protein
MEPSWKKLIWEIRRRRKDKTDNDVREKDMNQVEMDQEWIL